MCSSLFLMTSPSIPRNPAYDPIAHDRNDVWNRKAASSLSRWGNEHPPPSRAHSYNSSLCVSPTSIRPQGKGAAQCHWVLNSCEITEFYFQFLPSGRMHRGFPGGSDSKKKKKKIILQCRRPGFNPWEDPLEEGMATHSSILAWRIPMDRGAWRAREELGMTEWLSPHTENVGGGGNLRMRNYMKHITEKFYLLLLLFSHSFVSDCSHPHGL